MSPTHHDIASHTSLMRRHCCLPGEAESASGRATELEAEVGRLTELVAKLEEDLLAADAGGGAGGGERHKAGINGIVANGEAEGCRWDAARHAVAADGAVHALPLRQRKRICSRGWSEFVRLVQGLTQMAT